MASVDRFATWAFALVLALPSSAQEAAPKKPEPPPIVLVTLSGVRRDHLGLYGYPRDTSPNLDALARECIVFERACTPMASFLPAHLSLMTGAYPHQHGVVDPLSVQKNPWRPTEKLRTVAQLLQTAGYRTAAIVSARPVARNTGLDAGFQSFDDPGGFEVRETKVVTERAGAWLGEHKGERFFLWLHYRGALPPNKPPQECLAPFQSGEQLDALIQKRGIEPKRFELGVNKNSVLRMLFPDDGRKAFDGIQLPPIELASFESLFNRYDGDLRCADAQLGALVAKLKELGLWERAIVAVVSDCGFSLGQHDELEAGEIHCENVAVPWLLHLPRGMAEQPSRVARTVSLIDVMPTVLARFDNAALAPLLAQAPGRDALSASYAREWALSQRQEREKSSQGIGSVWALTSERWKYVWRPELSDKLFDLEADPYESNDLSKAEPDIAAALKAELQAAVAAPAGK
jgi:arylsulfatase A-like enzyme